MLRKIRLTFAMICFALITLLFLDFTGTLHGWFGWLAKIQFLPAVLALNVGVILFLVILTLVCGRIYCSVICPLGAKDNATFLIFIPPIFFSCSIRFYLEPDKSVSYILYMT